MEINNLTADEIDFILKLIENVQLGGTPAQVREALEVIDSIVIKLSPEQPPQQ